MCVNNLPKVVTWKRNGQESNRDPLSRESNIITRPGLTRKQEHSELYRKLNHREQIARRSQRLVGSAATINVNVLAIGRR